jgi:hypothetical protein
MRIHRDDETLHRESVGYVIRVLNCERTGVWYTLTDAIVLFLSYAQDKKITDVT